LRQLAIGQLSGATKPDSPLSSGREALSGALRQHATFEFRASAQD